ncbi:MAG: PaaI family thioesterase [Rhodospirillaceae bacterium]|jgi:acyl-coenzyme A thioesterase 13|nr:PaaI family thioesterase [Rhodospirillaceae bacterium]MBT6512901.1 PaaI family thioesterase [Rhodospirillaceae bacterium]MBT7613811.1 PaaI family thioesterase [Rhodospirillaceae bacterium]MBT7647528.1 PaaI family thioesterase [Rhodospirillaceae bacterium]
MSENGQIPEGFERVVAGDPYEVHNGQDYRIELGEGRVEVGLLADRRHANEYDWVHGGVMMMLADAALCMNSRWHDPNEGSITVSATNNFVKGAKIGEFLQTRSHVVRRTRQFSFVNCEVVVGERVCMTATGIIKRMLPEGDG